MNETQLRALFEQLREGAVDVDQALAKVRHMPFEDLGFAKVDHHREMRHGMPEVILGQGKTAEQVESIAAALLKRSPNLLLTRAPRESLLQSGERLYAESPKAFVRRMRSYWKASRPRTATHV